MTMIVGGIEVHAFDAEIAYRTQACWFAPNKWVPVTDKNGELIAEFSRKLDNAGNLIAVLRRNPE